MSALGFLEQLCRNIVPYSKQLVSIRCKHGLESDCSWIHNPNSDTYWQFKTEESGESFVEFSGCAPGRYCGFAIIETPWLPTREEEIFATLKYKIYGTSAVYLRLNLLTEDGSPTIQIFSKNGNYAYRYPDSWRSVGVRIPATHARYKLLLKAFVPYVEAMVAVKGINLDVSSGCEHAFELACSWKNHPANDIDWQLKKESGEYFVEVSKCPHWECDSLIIETPWLPPREEEIFATLNYKFDGSPSVYLKLIQQLDTGSTYEIFSKNGSIEDQYTDFWTSVDVRIPITRTRYKLNLKASALYSDSMVAVKGINLEDMLSPQ